MTCPSCHHPKAWHASVYVSEQDRAQGWNGVHCQADGCRCKSTSERSDTMAKKADDAAGAEA